MTTTGADAAQLALIPPTGTHADPRPTSEAGWAPHRVPDVTMVTWNVQNASPARARLQVTWLAASAADIAVLTEVPKADGGRALAQALSEHGFTTHTTRVDPAGGPTPLGATSTSPAAAVRTAQSTTVRDYVVIIAVRRHALERIEGPQTSALPHRLALARVHLDGAAGGGSLGLAGVYVPSRGPAARRNVDKRAFQAAVTRVVPDLPRRLAPSLDLPAPPHTSRCDRHDPRRPRGRRDAHGPLADPGIFDGPVLVLGDLNVLEPDHVPTHANFGTWEYDFYRSFAEHGFIDAYRHLHPSGTDHSWFGRRSGAGYRFDHIFCSVGHADALTGCWYDHQPRELGLSDHSALFATVLLTTAETPTSNLR